jgi:diguanylate cyclase (GGDEF)-like protein
MTGSARTKELFRLLKESGIDDDPDWMAVVLFIRNLLPRLTIYTDEKKAEIQQEVRDQLLTGDFSEKRFEAILAMLEMYIMQNIGTLELEAALTSEKRSASQLVNEMAVIISSMQGVNERQADRLGTFEEDTVDIIQSGSKRSMIVSGVRGMFQELIQEFETEASELNAKASYFERTANFDPLLSELYNRRAFDDYTEEAVKGRRQGDPPLSMMMIDVDHFKKVNDTYGHQTGDDVLRALARIISAHASHYSGFAARYGGEELVLVMNNMNLDTAAIKAEAIRYDVQNYGFRARENGRFSDDTLQFTVSIGVAQWQEGWSASKLIDAADTALYQAKNSGRNRVCSTRDQ